MKNLINLAPMAWPVALVAALLLSIATGFVFTSEKGRLQAQISELSAELSAAQVALSSSEQTVGALELDIDRLNYEAASLGEEFDAAVDRLNSEIALLSAERDAAMAFAVAQAEELDGESETARARGALLADYIRAFGADIPTDTDTEVDTEDDSSPGVLATAGSFWSSAWSALTAKDVVVGMPSAQASEQQGVN
jgi:hypothetical protein